MQLLRDGAKGKICNCPPRQLLRDYQGQDLQLLRDGQGHDLQLLRDGHGQDVGSAIWLCRGPPRGHQPCGASPGVSGGRSLGPQTSLLAFFLFLEGCPRVFWGNHGLRATSGFGNTPGDCPVAQAASGAAAVSVLTRETPDRDFHPPFKAVVFK